MILTGAVAGWVDEHVAWFAGTEVSIIGVNAEMLAVSVVD